MEKYLKIILVIIYMCFTNKLYSQEEIKKLIYSDFISLNESYKYTFVPEKVKYFIINEKDTIDESYIWNEKKIQYQNVNIISIDSFDNFYAIKVNFNKLHSKCYGLFNSNNQFMYILYKDKASYLKIDGFMVSEIMNLNNLEGLKKFAKNLGEEKRLNNAIKAVSKRKIEDARKSLRISIIYTLSKTVPGINYFPYMIDSSIGTKCNTVD